MLEKLRETAYRHALLNAVKHGGKAQLKPVVAKVIAEIPEIRSSIREAIPVIREVVEEVNRLSYEEQVSILKKEYPELLEERPRGEEEKKLPPLPGAEKGRVKTRFAPNPDYTIHLGNARAAMLSYWYAEMYSGTMVLRFEDTDPRTKAPFPEAYEKIKEDLRWLGARWGEEYIQSLRMPIFYNVIRELIERGGAYVDHCPANVFREYRDRGKPCPHRERAVEDNLEDFDKMLEGAYGEGEVVVRVKTDLSHPDPSVRDWVAARIIDTGKTPHPVVGDKYVVWPTYNLAAAVDDHLMGITHIFRGKEHMSNTVKQKYLYDHMGWVYPETIHIGRLSLEGVMLSKSLMRKKIREGYRVYDDPRFGTLAALRRRGIVPETIHTILMDVGTKGVDAYISYANLAAVNRKIIDPRARRYMAVENPVTVVIEGLETPVSVKIPRHPGRKEYIEHVLEKPRVLVSGSDVSLFLENKLVRLMELGNVELRDTGLGTQGPYIRVVYRSRGLEEAKKAGAPIIQWVDPENMVSIVLVEPVGETLVARHLVAEQYLEEEPDGALVQFYRIGFARLEKKDTGITAVYAHQ